MDKKLVLEALFSRCYAPRVLDARQLKARVDLVAFAGQFTRLKRVGRQFLGLCPLHKERHPSFFINPEKKVFHCFGCGAGGDVFVFVMRATGCDFRCALEIVADFTAGVASGSDPRSGPRLAASKGGEAPSAREAGALHSQSTQRPRARILVSLDAADRRLQAIHVTNRTASAALATACEPERVGPLSLLEETR
jgi:hypothetical protein